MARKRSKNFTQRKRPAYSKATFGVRSNVKRPVDPFLAARKRKGIL